MARLVVKNGVARGQEFPLMESQTIGRLGKNGIPIEDTRMSRENSRVYKLGRRWLVEDLSSKNGTFLNGSKIEKAVLSEGDEVRVGETHFTLVFDEYDQLDEPTADASNLSSKDMGISKKALSYSKFAGDDATKTSFLWIRQDLGQREGSFRYLIILGMVLFAVGLFFLIQMFIAG
ncbi:MAG: pSer/pThr/pTyr-binding forkhead associated (FHA) protein [Planctomycetota bacterium]|jgi:pSer/pThr/pTyr-binding forkhead associated (FHA) protein